MIWRRKHLTPATLLFIMMKIFTGHTQKCRPREYPADKRCCPKCPAGSRVETDCSEFRTTSCLPCLDGTFRNKPTGRKDCFPCISCDEGWGLKVKTSCTTTLDAVCEPLEGFYCIDPIGNNCVAAQKHRICHPGQYIKQTGTAFTDTVCSDCSTGTFSDGTFTSCQPHTHCKSINLQLIKPGNVSADAECGEKRSNVAAAVIITCVLLSVLISAGFVLFFSRKECVEDQENEDEEQSSEAITIPPD